LTFQKDITVKAAKNEGWGAFQFNRMLYGETLQQWNVVKRLVDEFQPVEEPDRVKWKIGSSGTFRVKDLYL
jgi:hypothetical protein